MDVMGGKTFYGNASQHRTLLVTIKHIHFAKVSKTYLFRLILITFCRVSTNDEAPPLKTGGGFDDVSQCRSRQVSSKCTCRADKSAAGEAGWERQSREPCSVCRLLQHAGLLWPRGTTRRPRFLSTPAPRAIQLAFLVAP